MIRYAYEKNRHRNVSRCYTLFFWLVGISDLKHVGLLTRLDRPNMSQVSESALLGFNMLQFMSPKIYRYCYL